MRCVRLASSWPTPYVSRAHCATWDRPEMNEGRIALLPDRGVVSVAGEDARKLLQGVVTNDMDVPQPALFAGLLSPQGKVLLDFVIARDDRRMDRYLLDVSREKAAELVKRLSMYRLRAKVAIEDVGDEFSVAAV